MTRIGLTVAAGTAATLDSVLGGNGSSHPSRIARILVAAGAAAAFVFAPISAAPVVVADPSDLVPVCSGDEAPGLDACRTACPEGAPANSSGSCSEPGTHSFSGSPSGSMGGTGADPEVPLGPQ
jgi:hypothetical protein